jgi:hypothetical protein
MKKFSFKMDDKEGKESVSVTALVDRKSVELVSVMYQDEWGNDTDDYDYDSEEEKIFCAEARDWYNYEKFHNKVIRFFKHKQYKWRMPYLWRDLVNFIYWKPRRRIQWKVIDPIVKQVKKICTFIKVFAMWNWHRYTIEIKFENDAWLSWRGYRCVATFPGKYRDEGFFGRKPTLKEMFDCWKQSPRYFWNVIFFREHFHNDVRFSPENAEKFMAMQADRSLIAIEKANKDWGNISYMAEFMETHPNVKFVLGEKKPHKF